MDPGVVLAKLAVAVGDEVAEVARGAGISEAAVHAAHVVHVGVVLAELGVALDKVVAFGVALVGHGTTRHVGGGGTNGGTRMGGMQSGGKNGDAGDHADDGGAHSEVGHVV